jgi:hypothetical protein
VAGFNSIFGATPAPAAAVPAAAVPAAAVPAAAVPAVPASGGGFDMIRNGFDSIFGPAFNAIEPSTAAPAINVRAVPTFPGDDDALVREVLNNLTDPESYDLLVRHNPEEAQRFQAELAKRAVLAAFGDDKSKAKGAVFDKARAEIQNAFARSKRWG